MANKHFPQDMVRAAQMGKMCFLSDIQSPNPNDCANCGGLGLFNLFIASEGPFQEPAFPYNGTDKDHKTSHWYNGGWWVGKSYNFTCPDCKGQGRYKVMRELAEAQG